MSAKFCEMILSGKDVQHFCNHERGSHTRQECTLGLSAQAAIPAQGKWSTSAPAEGAERFHWWHAMLSWHSKSLAYVCWTPLTLAMNYDLSRSA